MSAIERSMVANPKIKSIPLSEKEVYAQTKAYLESQGYLVIRLQSGLLRTKDSRFMRLGVNGMPDAVALKSCYEHGYTRTVFLEMKRSSGGKLSTDQLAWHADAKKKGLLVIVVDDFDKFKRRFEDTFKSRRGNGICDDPTVPLSMW